MPVRFLSISGTIDAVETKPYIFYLGQQSY